MPPFVPERLDPTGPLAFGELKRNVALAGATVRPLQKVSLNVDYERRRYDQDYFRISLYNYYKVRARARYQASPSLWFQANFHAAGQPESDAWRRLQFPQPGQFAGSVLDARRAASGSP